MSGPRPETVEKYEQVKSILTKGGMSLKDATKKVGLSRPAYQAMRRGDPDGINLRRGTTVKKKRAFKKSKPAFVDLPMHVEEEKDKAVVIVCGINSLKNVLAGVL